MAWWHQHAQSTSVHWVGIITAAGAVVAAGGVWFAARSVKEAENSRRLGVSTLHAQTAMEISRRWADAPLVECRRLVRGWDKKEDLARALKQYLDANAAEFYILQRELDFFEDLAIAEELGMIHWDFIEAALGEVVCDRWDMREPAVTLIWGDSEDVYSHFRSLAGKMRNAKRPPTLS